MRYISGKNHFGTRLKSLKRKDSEKMSLLFSGGGLCIIMVNVRLKMSNKEFDFSKVMENVFDTARDVASVIAKKGEEFIKESGLKDVKDYYPLYSWPPVNIYTDDNQDLVMEFSLAGFKEEDIHISFKKDDMILSAEWKGSLMNHGEIKYIKNKLKLRSIEEQKYYVPAERFDQEGFRSFFDNGLLRVTVPGTVDGVMSKESEES